jgi:hypothetical protein
LVNEEYNDDGKNRELHSVMDAQRDEGLPRCSIAEVRCIL